MNEDATQVDPSVSTVALDATQAAAPSNGGMSFTAPLSVSRSTVLPRVVFAGVELARFALHLA